MHPFQCIGIYRNKIQLSWKSIYFVYLQFAVSDPLSHVCYDDTLIYFWAETSWFRFCCQILCFQISILVCLFRCPPDICTQKNITFSVWNAILAAKRFYNNIYLCPLNITLLCKERFYKFLSIIRRVLSLSLKSQKLVADICGALHCVLRIYSHVSFTIARHNEIT